MVVQHQQPSSLLPYLTRCRWNSSWSIMLLTMSTTLLLVSSRTNFTLAQCSRLLHPILLAFSVFYSHSSAALSSHSPTTRLTLVSVPFFSSYATWPIRLTVSSIDHNQDKNVLSNSNNYSNSKPMKFFRWLHQLQRPKSISQITDRRVIMSIWFAMDLVDCFLF